jgi:hypothetical protein
MFVMKFPLFLSETTWLTILTSSLALTVPIRTRGRSLEGKGEKGKSIPVTRRGGLQVFETWILPHCLGNRLTDGDEVSLTLRQPFTSLEHFC